MKQTPANRPARTTFTPAIAAAILAHLTDGRPPFLALAAERAGVNRHTLNTWIARAEHAPDPEPALVDFVTELRRVRAEYMTKLADEITKTTKDNEPAARQKQFLLMRLDSDLFDPPKRTLEHVKPPPPEAPQPPSPEDLKQAVASLETPETLQ